MTEHATSSTSRQIHPVHFMSMTDEWRTPKSIYTALDAEFHFDHDPCPIYDGGWSHDGLLADWGEVNFCNPPYSDLKNWIPKGYEQWKLGKTVVFLIPSRTDTAWWHDYVMEATEIRFIRGRLSFEGPKKNPGSHNAPFPSCVVVFQ